MSAHARENFEHAPLGAFGEAPEDRALLEELVRVGPPEAGEEAAIPLSRSKARVQLADLGVEAVDARDVVDSLPTDESSSWWWCVERTSRLISREIGTPHPPDRGRPVFEGGSELPIERRCFLAHVFLSVLQRTRAWHRRMHIPDEVSRASFADLGRHLAIHRRRFGVTGVDGGWWVTMPLRGVLFDLGRVQFERSLLGSGYASSWEAPWPSGRDFPLRLGGWCLGVHIPESGPLRPDAVTQSFASARSFFPRYFSSDVADSRRIVATCTSWMLDPQLSNYLPEASNVIQFQQRFAIVEGGPPDDGGIVRFVFRRPLDDLDALPQRTTLERAVVAHLRAGAHWHSTSGWLAIDITGRTPRGKDESALKS